MNENDPFPWLYKELSLSLSQVATCLYHSLIVSLSLSFSLTVVLSLLMDVQEHNDFINAGKEETAIGKRQCLDPKKVSICILLLYSA